ncbi:MAG: DUF3883 domain-containing protein [Haliscomenobacter sp.]|nr:DUF3883 domain-containing protein [Haliscomenobacter sp.]
MKKPSHIYFPAVEFSNEFSDDISIIHKSIVSDINANARIKSWLEYLGVKEPSDLSFIEKTIIEQGDTFVTEENAIEIGRYLFNAHKKGVLQEQHYEKLQSLKLLTKENFLIIAGNSFLPNFYEPELKLENSYKNDFYISENYLEGKDLKSEWKTFFVKIGVNQNLFLQTLLNKSTSELVYNFGCFNDFFENNRGYEYTGWVTAFRVFHAFTITKISFIERAINYSFSKLFWQNVFLSIAPENFRQNYKGHWGNRGEHYDIYGAIQNVSYNDWVLNNKGIIPTTQKNCLKLSEVYSNTIPQVFEIVGKYLPVFDYEGAVPPEWQDYLKFNPTLGLNEYLQILSSIWRENSQDEILLKENQKRIGLIYEKLALMNFHSSEKEKIKGWANSNKLLAKNGTDFYYPKDLSIVAVEGFRASNLAFTEKQSPEIIELLRLFGVQIIDKVNATISNSKVEITDLKTKLQQISPLIALVAVEKSKNRKDWEDEYERIRQKLAAIRFFETSEIYLSYGNEDDRQKRSSWAENDNFYYVGKWYSPRVLDGLVEPLGAFLKIRYAERILTVLLLETFAEGIEYLNEKGFDISLIPHELQSLKEPEIRVINQGNRAYNQSDEDLGKQGELVVFEKLKQKYSQKYGQSVEETLTGFKVGEKIEVFWRNKNHTTTANHDFKVVELGKEIYIDSKATPYGKNIEKVPLYISGSELDLMEIAEKYLIARVYNATSGTNVEVEFVRLQIDSP